MVDPDAPEQGLYEEHTPPAAEKNGENSGGSGDIAEPDAARAAKMGSGKAAVDAAVMDLVDKLAGDDDEPDQLDLLGDTPFAGPVKHVADRLDSWTGKGRKPGAKNKANQLFRDTMMAMGYRHPALNIAALANADPLELAAELKVSKRADVVKLVDMIRKANADLLPYFESKRPTEVHVQRAELGMMLVGEMSTATGGDDEIIDITGGAKQTKQNQGVSDMDTVRHSDDMSHGHGSTDD